MMGSKHSHYCHIKRYNGGKLPYQGAPWNKRGEISPCPLMTTGRQTRHVGLRNAKPGPVRRRARRGRGGAVFQGDNGNDTQLAEVWRTAGLAEIGRLVEPSELPISQRQS